MMSHTSGDLLISVWRSRCGHERDNYSVRRWYLCVKIRGFATAIRSPYESPNRRPRAGSASAAPTVESTKKISPTICPRITIEAMMLNAIATLRDETKENIEAASVELQRSNEKLLNSHTRANNLDSAREMTVQAIALVQAAIEKLDRSLEMPELINNFNRTDVRTYALELISKTIAETDDIDVLLGKSMVDWQLSRLPKIDRDILRLAVAEIVYLGLEERIAINEAIELAKRYSDEQGRKLINGVLRRVTEQLKSGV
jgi:transcription antitermination protein NusB